MSLFKQAVKSESKLRLALVGPSGSGKTFSALGIASGLGSRIAVVDTERGSASKYAGEFTFDVLELDSHHPQNYIDAIRAAEKEGYDVVVIDSLSHAWTGKDGALDLVDKAVKRAQSGNSFAAWRDITPLHNALVDTILSARLHVIVTMRARTEYVVEEDARGKKVPKKIGLAPVQREGVEYEFDVVGDLNLDHDLVVSKTRCSILAGKIIPRPGAALGETLQGWLHGDVVAELPELRDIRSLGEELYGAEWSEKCGDLVSAITQGSTRELEKLNRSEATRLLEGLRKRQREMAEA
jgi:KaiC/GvpD/RAD55 family RecA-like ATPase